MQVSETCCELLGARRVVDILGEDGDGKERRWEECECAGLICKILQSTVFAKLRAIPMYLLGRNKALFLVVSSSF